MRDLGGYLGLNNKKVNYSLLYRSINWSGANSVAESRLKALKMKTELDIRIGHTTCDHPIDGIEFVNLGISQYDAIVPGSGRYWKGAMSSLGSIFDLLSKEESYPLTFHCTHGADRTGTLAFLILGLLGVDYEDICRDFELTSFYYGKRWRSNITYDSVDGYKFAESGIMQDDELNYVAFNKLYYEMMKNFGTASGILSDAITNYLSTACNVPNATIESVRNILLG